MPKAVKMLPQYLFPNGQTVAFGDSNYGPLNPEAMSDMIRIAQKNNDKELEEEFTGMYRLFAQNKEGSEKGRKVKAKIS